MGGDIRSRMFSVFLIAAAVCVFVSSGVAQTNNAVTATVQPAQITVGDSATYQIAVVVTGSGQPSVAIPLIDSDTGLSTPSSQGTQNSLETYIVNGNFRSVQRITYNYSIKATKAGSFTIPPATVTLNGKNYETKSVKLEVHELPKARNIPSELKGLVVAPEVSGNSELQRKLTGVVFVLPVISNKEPYNGEQVRVSYHLVIDREGLLAAGLSPQTNLDGYKVPPMNEFITNELFPFPQDLKFQERKIADRVYLVAPVYEAVVSSTKSGKLEIEPFQISMIFSQRSRSGRPASPFANDPFFSSLSPMMMGGNSVQVIAQSPQLTVDVKPVPQQGRPANFAGAVGSFKIDSVVDKKQAKAYDDTVELNLTVEGQGNADSLSPPVLPDMPGFTVLGSPEQKSSGRKDGDNYVSSKKFTYTLRPTTPGKQTIPAIDMSYFEPRKKSFVSIASDPITLDISPGAHPAPLPVPSVQDNEEPANEQKPAEPDLRYISTEHLTEPDSGLARFHGLTGVLVFLFPPILLAFAGTVSRARHRSQNRSIDERKLAKSASAMHLKQAHHALDAGQTKEMASELSDGMRLFFASHFGMPGAEVTIPEIEERLAAKGAPTELIDGISRILEACDSAQYGPASGSQANAQQTWREANELMKQAEEYLA